MKRIALFLLVASCTDDGAAFQALKASGFTEISLTGYSFAGCSKDDGTCTGFTAKGPTGVRVSGAVGCGYVFKGCTVRLGTQ